MKTRISLLVLVILACTLLVAACGNATNKTTSAGDAAQNPTANTTLSSETKLAIGTLKLAGTDQDLTAAQATELLTLWQAYQTLSASETTADAELTALVNQIQGTMTAEQTQAIDQMQITAETLAEVLQSAMPEIPGVVSGTPAASASSQAAAGGGPGGAPMDDGGPGGNSGIMMGDPAMGAQATPDAANQTSTQASKITPALLNTLIQMLAAKSQATSR